MEQIQTIILKSESGELIQLEPDIESKVLMLSFYDDSSYSELNIKQLETLIEYLSKIHKEFTKQ